MSLLESNLISNVYYEVLADSNLTTMDKEYLGLADEYIIEYKRVDLLGYESVKLETGIYESYDEIVNELKKQGLTEDEILKILEKYGISSEDFFETKCIVYCGKARSPYGYDMHDLTNVYLKDNKLSVAVDVYHSSGGTFNVNVSEYLLIFDKTVVNSELVYGVEVLYNSSRK